MTKKYYLHICYLTNSSNIMKTILVDAINTFVLSDKTIFDDMYKLLEQYPNRKIILTGANDEQMKTFGLNNMPYEVYTLKHNPEKTDPKYYKMMLNHFELKADEAVYFEHNEHAVESARSVGISTYHYDKDAQDLFSLKAFIEDNIS